MDPVRVMVVDDSVPVMDGMMTLRQIRTRWPGLPVVMMSGLPRRGVEAVEAGAAAYVAKPARQRDRPYALAVTRDRLEPLLREVRRARAGCTRSAGA